MRGRRAVGRHRRRAQGHPRGQRGHLDDHAELHRHRAGRPTCSRAAPGQRGGRVDRHDTADPESGWFPSSTGCSTGSAWPSRATAALRLPLRRRRRRRRSLVLLGRTRFGFDLRATGVSPSAAAASGVDARGMIVKTMMLSGAVAGLVGLPDAARRRPTSTAPTSPPASASPASPSPCWAATTRSASRSRRCCGPSWTRRPCRCSRRHPEGDRPDHAGHRSCCPS